MGNYSVPEEIRKMKPAGSMVKVIKGNYYVYSHSQHKDPVTGKWKTDSGELIGKIVPGIGFCPKGSKCANERITCFDYGDYLLASSLSKCDFELLKEVFNPDEAMMLFSMGIMFALEGYIGIKATEEKFERSLIHRDYPALKYSTYRISQLLELIGRQEKAKEFQNKCIADAETIAIDGHVIPSDSEKNDLSALGYKAKNIKSEQMNLLVALDVSARMPVATKVFPGYMVDKKDFLEFIGDISDINSKLFLMDSGFFSRENMNYIVDKKAKYVIPISSNMDSYKEVSTTKRGRLASFLYHTDHKTDIVEYKEKLIDGHRIIFYRNISEKEKIVKDYMAKIEEGKKGYTEKGLKEQESKLGVIVLETNLDESPETVYHYYKSRWEIETYYDRIKNGLDFEELNLSDYAMVQGVAFVMMLAGRIDARILAAAKQMKMTRKELVRVMSGLKLVDNGKSAVVHNMKTTHENIATTLSLSFDTNMKCLG